MATLPEEKRPPVKYTREQLQLKNVGGDLPAYDGEQFREESVSGP